MPPPGYLAGVRALCDRYGIVLILDEVMAGFGRTGDWFAFDHFDVRPDLITFAKGVNSGYVPVGGVVISEDDRRHVRGPGLPRRAHLLRASARDGDDRRDAGGDGRRSGSWRTPPGSAPTSSGPASPRSPSGTRWSATCAGWGSSGPSSWSPTAATREPLAAPVMARLGRELLDRGLLPFLAENRVHVVPPCVVTDDEVRRALDIYDAALTAIEGEVRA